MSSIKSHLIRRLLAFKNYFSAAILISLSLISLSIAVITSLVHSPGPLDQKVTLLIKPGYSTAKIASLLQEHNVISYPSIFIIFTKILNKAPLKAGEYEFQPNINLLKIVKLLVKGESIIRKITVPEGVTTSQIVDMLIKEPRLAGQIAEIPAEGSLFPSTYYFKYGDLRNQLLKSMEQKMIEVVSKLFINLPPNSPIQNTDQLLTFASIVEKEAGNDEEKPIIASVFFNRLKKNMRLQADPTVIYGLTLGQTSLGRALTRKDLQTPSYYNTYIIYGMPSGPIACPGLKSLEATVKPANTKYLYFVVNGKGGHNFSDNLSQHNSYVQTYRKMQN